MTGPTAVKERPAEVLATGNQPLSGNDRGRSVDRKRMSWYTAVLCRCGIHSGDWGYVTQGNCKQLKVCGRCGTTMGRIKHQREWRYVRDGACEQRKTCRRCGDMTRERTNHKWGSTYTPATRHDYAHRCLRCGTVQEWDASNDD